MERSVLFTALIDGTFSYWKLNDSQEWQLLGSELFNTYRITDICSWNFPQIVIGIPVFSPFHIATWEGSIYVKQYVEQSHSYLQSITTIDTKPIVQPGGRLCIYTH